MRKYLAATVIGAMLLAGQAAAQSGASDSAVVNLGDRLGSSTDTTNDLSDKDKGLIVGVALITLGLIVWGFSQTGPGRPVSP
jgi:hypothetical protein